MSRRMLIVANSGATVIDPLPFVTSLATKSICWLLLTTLMLAQVFAVEPADQGATEQHADTHEWPLQFVDDMQVDRRNKYGKQGEIVWQPGAIILPAHTTLWPMVEPGPRLELKVRLEFAKLEQDGDHSQTEFVVPLRNSLGLMASLENRRLAGNVMGEIQLLQQRQENGAQNELLLRRFPMTDGLASGEWTFRYRYGLLLIECNGKEVAAGYIAHTKSVAGIMCFQRRNAIGILGLELMAETRPNRQYSDQQQMTFQTATVAYRIAVVSKDIKVMLRLLAYRPRDDDLLTLSDHIAMPLRR